MAGRDEIDDMLQQLDEAAASAPEGEERAVFFDASWWFHHTTLSPEDAAYAVSGMGEIAHKYEIDLAQGNG